MFKCILNIQLLGYSCINTAACLHFPGDSYEKLFILRPVTALSNISTCNRFAAIVLDHNMFEPTPKIVNIKNYYF